jgi:hypothetical protein
MPFLQRQVGRDCLRKGLEQERMYIYIYKAGSGTRIEV